MIKASAYINGSSCISPQQSFENSISNLTLVHNDLKMLCLEPDYKAILGSAIGRRMGKLTKMGITTASMALKEAGIENPDAIITGTGLGCMIETEKFLIAMIENNEEMLNPTAFMQSTHNTLGGQIALMLRCKNYNFTYVNKGFSFESALLDSLMKLNSNESQNILVGGFDEMTENHFKITNRLGYWKSMAVFSNELLQSISPGSLAGECASFFVLSNNKNENTHTQFAGLSMFHKPQLNELAPRLEKFLAAHDLSLADIDISIIGRNGDSNDEAFYDAFEAIQPDIPIAYYKHLCGENYTTGAFALWLANRIMADQIVPETCQPKNFNNSRIKNILIYNHFRNSDHSFYLLKNCQNLT